MKGATMNFQDCIKFATENAVCFLATMDGDQPRVRGLALWAANEQGFYFTILSPKALRKQLQANPKVEICFYNNPSDLMDAKQMRVTGKVEFVNDPELQKKAADEGAFLDPIAGQPLGSLWQVIRIRTGEACFWTLADTLKEPTLEKIRFPG
jgi:pyridoxamine 5'-phosphate oxidase